MFIAPTGCRATGNATPLSARGVHVVPRQRMREPTVRKRFARQQLPQRQPPPLERMRRAGEVDPPDAIALLADLVARRIRRGFEPLAPAPERPRVMLAKRLAVNDFEALRRHPLDHLSDVR